MSKDNRNFFIDSSTNKKKKDSGTRNSISQHAEKRRQSVLQLGYCDNEPDVIFLDHLPHGYMRDVIRCNQEKGLSLTIPRERKEQQRQTFSPSFCGRNNGDHVCNGPNLFTPHAKQGYFPPFCGRKNIGGVQNIQQSRAFSPPFCGERKNDFSSYSRKFRAKHKKPRFRNLSPPFCGAYMSERKCFENGELPKLCSPHSGGERNPSKRGRDCRKFWSPSSKRHPITPVQKKKQRRITHWYRDGVKPSGPQTSNSSDVEDPGVKNTSIVMYGQEIHGREHQNKTETCANVNDDSDDDSGGSYHLPCVALVPNFLSEDVLEEDKQDCWSERGDKEQLSIGEESSVSEESVCTESLQHEMICQPPNSTGGPDNLGSSIICLQYPKPKMQYCSIPRYFGDKKGAPKHSQYIAIETADNQNSISSVVSEKLLDVDIRRVDVLQRGTIGCYLANNLHERTHYSIHGEASYQRFYERVRSLNLEFGLSTLRRGRQLPRLLGNLSNYCVVANNHHFEELVMEMKLPEIAKDLLFPEMGKVPIRNTVRGNRGCSFGFTGNQGCLRVSTSRSNGISEPVLMTGSQRYQHLFVKMTNLLEKMVAFHNLPRAFVDHGDNIDLNDADYRLKMFAQRIHPHNKLESVSFLCMLDDYENSPEINDMLKEHRDIQNCANVGWNNCLVVHERVFVDSIGRWVTLIVSGTSRRSISDYLQRRKVVSRAGDKLWLEYQNAKSHMQKICPDLLCRDENKERILDGVHFEPSLHYSPLIYHVKRLMAMTVNCNPDVEVHSKMGKVEHGLMEEMVYAFFLTNNAMRFNSFARMIGFEMQRQGKGTKKILGKTFNFTIEFLRFAFSTYGCWNGKSSTLSKNSGEVKKSLGATRYQATTNCPISDLAVEESLRNLRSIVDHVSSLEPSMAAYKENTKSIQDTVHGIGKLCSQKILHVFCYLGRLKTGWLHYCLPGSQQHFQKLRDSHGFETYAQVESLIHYIASKGDVGGTQKMTLAKSEEIVCNLLKKNRTIFCDAIPFECDIYYSQWSDDEERLEIRVLDHKLCEDKLLKESQICKVKMDKCKYVTRWEGNGLLVKSNCTSKVLKRNTMMASLSSTENELIPKAVGNKKISKSGSTTFEQFVLSDIQSMLNTSKYLVVSEKKQSTFLQLLSIQLHIRADLLRTKITISGCAEHGFLADFKPEFVDGLDLIHDYLTPGLKDASLQMSVDRHSISENTGYRFKYCSATSAVHALLFHALLTTRRKNSSIHWLDRFVDAFDSFIFLYPDRKMNGAVHCLCLFYLHAKDGSCDYSVRMVDVDRRELTRCFTIT